MLPVAATLPVSFLSPASKQPGVAGVLVEAGIIEQHRVAAGLGHLDVPHGPIVLALPLAQVLVEPLHDDRRTVDLAVRGIKLQRAVGRRFDQLRMVGVELLARRTEPRRYAITLARSCWFKSFSNPSGIIDLPVALQFFQIGPQDRLLLALLRHQGDAVAGFVGQHAGVASARWW